MRDGAEAARLVHTQKVGGASPSPATNYAVGHLKAKIPDCESGYGGFKSPSAAQSFIGIYFSR